MLRRAKGRRILQRFFKSKALGWGCAEIMDKGSNTHLVDQRQRSVAGQIRSNALVEVCNSTFYHEANGSQSQPLAPFHP